MVDGCGALLLRMSVSQVCGVVDGVLDGSRGVVDRSILLDAGVRPGYSTAVARSFLCWLLHDVYGCSYSRIGRLLGFSVRNVMRHVGRCRHLRLHDVEYRSVSDGLYRLLGIEECKGELGDGE